MQLYVLYYNQYDNLFLFVYLVWCINLILGITMVDINVTITTSYEIQVHLEWMSDDSKKFWNFRKSTKMARKSTKLTLQLKVF